MHICELETEEDGQIKITYIQFSFFTLTDLPFEVSTLCLMPVLPSWQEPLTGVIAVLAVLYAVERGEHASHPAQLAETDVLLAT